MRRGVRGKNAPAVTAFCDPDRVRYSFMFPKNSPFKLAINEGLNRQVIGNNKILSIPLVKTY